MLNAVLSLWCRKWAGRRCDSEAVDVRRLHVPVTCRARTCSDTGSAPSSSGATAAAVGSALSYAAVAVLAAGVYLNSVDGHFVHDDVVAVVKNDDVKPTTPLVDILRHDFWGQEIGSERSHKSYRPLCVATFRSVNKCFLCALPVATSNTVGTVSRK